MPPPPGNAVALVAPDGHIYSQPLSGGERLCLTAALEAKPGGSQLTFGWPAWSPDGGRLAFVGQERDAGEDAEGGLYLANSDGSGQRLLHRRQGERPFYIHWSPDGRRVAFLSVVAGRLALCCTTVEGLPLSTRLAEGQPFYLDWAPGGGELLLHVGGSADTNPAAFIGRLDPQGGEVRSLRLRPAEFRVPSWSPNGERMLLAVRAPQMDAIVAIDKAGADTILARFQGKAAFLWSPRGDRVAALLSRNSGGQGYQDGLYILEGNGGGVRLLAQEECLAFFWSPDGEKIAYVAVDRPRNRLTLLAVNADGTQRRRLASFLPSQSLLFVLSFFDQYSLSGSFWSPDSRYLVYSGKTFWEQSNGAGTDEADSIFMVLADGSETPRSLGQGSLAVFRAQG